MQGHPPNHSVAVAQAVIKRAVPPDDSDLSPMLSFRQDPAAGRTDLPYAISGLFSFAMSSPSIVSNFLKVDWFLEKDKGQSSGIILQHPPCLNCPRRIKFRQLHLHQQVWTSMGSRLQPNYHPLPALGSCCLAERCWGGGGGGKKPKPQP